MAREGQALQPAGQSSSGSCKFRPAVAVGNWCHGGWIFIPVLQVIKGDHPVLPVTTGDIPLQEILDPPNTSFAHFHNVPISSSLYFAIH
jgi:hypothetical protein